jgi:hypothetical protein
MAKRLVDNEWWWPKFGVLLPFALVSITRGITISPFVPHTEVVPSPLIFTSAPLMPVILSTCWFVAGMLLLISIFVGHKITLAKGAVARLRLDDVSIISVLFMYGLWGISYYGTWVHSTLMNHEYSAAYLSGRAYTPVAISGFIIWFIWFKNRTLRSTIHGLPENDDDDELYPTVK